MTHPFDTGSSDAGQTAHASLSSNVRREMFELITELFPICRSITGDGVRTSLGRIALHIPLEVHEVPTGTQVFDWTVPKEWNIRDAYIKNSRGERIVDFLSSNLHVLNYSVPVRETLSLDQLKEHVHTAPEMPDHIPYRTSYYDETWGFCMSHRQFVDLEKDEYDVCIDSSLVDGHLTYGELSIPGAESSEILISCHICHPSLCNDNLSGIALATFLAKHVQSAPRRYSYRFLFIPATIGSITWLSRNEDMVDRIKCGLVVANVGDAGPMHYKKSRRGDTELDRAVEHVLKQSGREHQISDFVPYGYDERQYCSPAFNLAVGSLTRTPYGCYPEYHTSADNLDFVKPAALEDSFLCYTAVLDLLENNRTYLNLNPACEPQLGRRGLYSAIGGRSDQRVRQAAMLWVLNLSDGYHTLLEVADRADLPFDRVRDAADLLVENGLLEELTA